ncbi:MAG: HlyD family efflux transporter periplasmic adaptor subunit [Lachnospiraceae bacterium]|nr:HlyD family efflux transporter periplasmic adaptor subunit [Lachnospiraceae bacterium]
MKKKKGKKKWIVIAVVVVLIVVMLFSCGKGSTTTLYEQVTAEKRDIVTYLEFAGNVEAVNSVNVYSDASAKVLEVKVKEGDKVKKGDVIAVLDSSDIEYNIAKSEVALAQSQKNNDYNIKDSQNSLGNLQEQISSGLNTSLNGAKDALMKAQENYQKAADTYNEAVLDYDADDTDAIAAAKKNLLSTQLSYNQSISQYTERNPISDETKAVLDNNLKVAKDNLEDAREQAKEAVEDYYDAFVDAEERLLDAQRDYEAAVLAMNQNLETYSNNLERTTALADLTSTQMDIDHMKESLEDYVIYASMDGYITGLKIKAGEYIGAATPVAEITDLSTMQAKIKIDEYDVKDVAVNDEVQIYINALDKTYEGRISSISKKAVSQSDVAFLESVVEFTTAEDISSGLSAEIKLVKSEELGVLALPMDAIQYHEDNTAYVLMYDAEGKEIMRDVTLGVSDGSWVQILDGVQEGETVLEMPNLDYYMQMMMSVE